VLIFNIVKMFKQSHSKRSAYIERHRRLEFASLQSGGAGPGSLRTPLAGHDSAAFLGKSEAGACTTDMYQRQIRGGVGQISHGQEPINLNLI
jgi:hypothetical protein